MSKAVPVQAHRMITKFAVILGFYGCAAASQNPIIPGFNPDPAILRVNHTYYIATSTFTYFPALPIYRSDDLVNWQLISHALNDPTLVQLNGISTGEGVWAPSLSYTDGRFYMTSMTRWGSDPTTRTWPRIWFTSSDDLLTWAPLTWAEPYGIDPQLFHDPNSNKTYLNLMSPSNNYDRIWGISQCEISLRTGRCIGRYQRLWNGTLPNDSTARPEGPKMFFHQDFYYLIAAEGGTSIGHRTTIARSRSPRGPWEEAPNNPLIFNGASNNPDRNLTVQSTGHATFTDTPDGRWFASLLARRNIKGRSPLGRESFLVAVDWQDGWPRMNSGKPLLLSENIRGVPEITHPRPSFYDDFGGPQLDLSWYQLRTPYTKNYHLRGSGKTNSKASATGKGVVLTANVFTLSDRDVPAGLFRKQTSLNMTFSAELLPTRQALGKRQSVGVSAYLSELTHQDIGIRGCWNSTGLCVYVDSVINERDPSSRPKSTETPLNTTNIPEDFSLHVRADPLRYRLGYSLNNSMPTWLLEFDSEVMTQSANYPNFEGAMIGIFASGNGEPWPFDAPDVGFKHVQEVYFEENIPDYDVWD